MCRRGACGPRQSFLRVGHFRGRWCRRRVRQGPGSRCAGAGVGGEAETTSSVKGGIEGSPGSRRGWCAVELSPCPRLVLVHGETEHEPIQVKAVVVNSNFTNPCGNSCPDKGGSITKLTL